MQIQWNSHLSAAGNSFFGSEQNNNAGQLDRRVVLFYFDKEVTRDPNLHDAIRDNMLPVMLKGMRAYRSLVAAAAAFDDEKVRQAATARHAEFDAEFARLDVLNALLLQGTDVMTYINKKTSYFTQALATLQTQKPLRNFVTSGMLVVGPDKAMPVSEFQDMFLEWCSGKGLPRQPMTTDAMIDCFVHLEAVHKTQDPNNRWKQSFQIEPKNNNGVFHQHEGKGYFVGISAHPEGGQGAPPTFHEAHAQDRHTHALQQKLARITAKAANSAGPAAAFLDT